MGCAIIFIHSVYTMGCAIIFIHSVDTMGCAIIFLSGGNFKPLILLKLFLTNISLLSGKIIYEYFTEYRRITKHFSEKVEKKVRVVLL
jgi:hypothetical protein